MANRFDTQDKLIAATRELIVSAGIEGCTLENICARAGFTRGAFYSNYSSKESLLAAVAQDEYANLIEVLRAKVDHWENEDRSAKQQEAPQLEDLLFEAIDAIGMNRELYILHSEMLARSVRHPAWGLQLKDLNNEFIHSLGDVLEHILQAVGREPTVPMYPLTHAVIGVVMRGAGIEAWRGAMDAYADERAAQQAAHGIAPGGAARAGYSETAGSRATAEGSAGTIPNKATISSAVISGTSANGLSPERISSEGLSPERTAVGRPPSRRSSLAQDILDFVLVLLRSSSRPISG
ncbi:TetR/AcrR family transcriptional regulator [Trueperella sp. LYQ143]|uniref:TetR/AcrR family transcriptional regulator n=1 Tax=unclassified Trueperella TaxID=2630174 RepID=UPI003982DDE0